MGLEVLKEDDSDELLNEELVLPWHTNLAEKTRADYFHDSRWFLEFAGFLDPSKVNHKPGNRAPEVKAVQRAATEAAFTEFLKQAHNKPRWATLQLLRFARQVKERVDRHELGPSEVRQRLAPFKKAFDVNGIAIPWKKITAIFPRYRRSTDREYRLDELQLLCSKGALHLRVAMLLMSGSGLRVGAFEYLDVRDIRPVFRAKEGGDIVQSKEPMQKLPEGATLLCGVLSVYAGEGDDQYEALCTKEAYETFQEYLRTRPTKTGPAILTRDFQRRVAPATIRNSLEYLLNELGMRGEKRGRRFEVQVDHGMRKWFDNSAKDHMEGRFVERLIGHDLGTEEHYDRRIPLKCVEQYLVAMPYLSVGESYRSEAALARRLERVEGEQAEQVRSLRAELNEVRVARVMEAEANRRRLEELDQVEARATEEAGRTQGAMMDLIRGRERRIAEMKQQRASSGAQGPPPSG
jgi:hypothetical protein